MSTINTKHGRGTISTISTNDNDCQLKAPATKCSRAKRYARRDLFVIVAVRMSFLHQRRSRCSSRQDEDEERARFIPKWIRGSRIKSEGKKMASIWEDLRCVYTARHENEFPLTGFSAINQFNQARARQAEAWLMKHPRDVSMIGSFDGGPTFSPAPLPSTALTDPRERGRLVCNISRTVKRKSVSFINRYGRPYRCSLPPRNFSTSLADPTHCPTLRGMAAQKERSTPPRASALNDMCAE